LAGWALFQRASCAHFLCARLVCQQLQISGCPVGLLHDKGLSVHISIY
jgi:hypothetical protein